MTKTKTLGFVIIFLVLLAAAVGVGAFIASSQDPQPDFETAVAKKGVITQTVEASGEVAYPETREAAFLSSGYLDTMKVVVGQVVTKDQLLATLRNTSGLTLPDEQQKLLELRAPMAGVVTAIQVHPGEVVGAGMPIVVIEGPAEQFETVLSVSENDITEIAVGDTANVSLEALGNNVSFVGRVLEIAPIANRAEGLTTYAVTVSLDYAVEDGKGAMSRLMPGMTADASIVTAENKNALIIPRRAVIISGGQEVVRVPADNDEGYEEHAVTTGLRDQDGNVMIVDGLVVGEEVITKIN